MKNNLLLQRRLNMCKHILDGSISNMVLRKAGGGKHLHKNVIYRLLLPGQSVKLSFIRLEIEHDKKLSEVLILSNLNTSFYPNPKQQKFSLIYKKTPLIH